MPVGQGEGGVGAFAASEFMKSRQSPDSLLFEAATAPTRRGLRRVDLPRSASLRRGGIRSFRLGVSRRLLALAATLSLLASVATAQPQKPARIVSLNTCVDQLLLLMADRARIASLTQFATDPEFTNMPEAARGFALNHGRAEEVLAFRPDLVIGGQYTTGATLMLLRRVGVRVETLAFANSLDDVRANMLRVAGWIGEAERGQALVRDFDARLAAVQARAARGTPPVVALYQSRGYTAAPGTLADSIVRAAGFANLAARMGLGESGRLSLEHLLAHDFDALVVADVRGQSPSLEVETLAHPALRHLLALKPHAALPSRLWICDTPSVLDAVERIAALHAGVPRPAPRP